MFIALLLAALLQSVFLLTELHLQLPVQIAPIRNRPLGPQGVAYDTRVIPNSARISSVNPAGESILFCIATKPADECSP